jgi:hypothetical protein
MEMRQNVCLSPHVVFSANRSGIVAGRLLCRLEIGLHDEMLLPLATRTDHATATALLAVLFSLDDSGNIFPDECQDRSSRTLHDYFSDDHRKESQSHTIIQL